MREIGLGTSLLLALAGCAGAEPPGVASATELRAAVPILTHAALAGATSGCTGSARLSRPFDALVVTGRQCLSCMDVGYATRRISRIANARDISFAVIAPIGDSASVCRTLRSEKYAGTVVLVRDDAIPWKDDAAPLLYLRAAGAEAEPIASIVAGDGVALIDSITLTDGSGHDSLSHARPP